MPSPNKPNYRNKNFQIFEKLPQEISDPSESRGKSKIHPKNLFKIFENLQKIYFIELSLPTSQTVVSDK